jgi:hypothetical protein
MTYNNKQASITYERVIWNCQNRFFLDKVDPNNQLIPLSKIPLSGFHSIHIFAYLSKQNNLFNELLVKVNFWIFVSPEHIF